MKLGTALAPNVENFGFALLLSMNATSVWGGIFPFLPDAARTSTSTVSFFAWQLAAYSLTFFVSMALAYRSPARMRSVSVLPGAAALSASGVMLVGAMYLEAASFALIVASALLFGMGSAMFMTRWQRVFASQEGAAGGLAIIVGTGYSAVLYFLICLIPVALTAYLIPLVMVPLAGLCLWVAGQRVDFDQPMFQDRPADHPAIYRNVVKESLGAAASIGALGFCAGAVRFILITHQSISSFVNLASMGVLLAVVLAYLALWRARTIRFDVMNFYRVIFPVMAVGLLLLPFMGEDVSTLGAAISYACFMLATVVMMMHCCQISRDSGINPVFIYGLFGCVIYLIQTAGYFVGYISGSEGALGIGQLSFVATASLFALLAASLAAGQSRPLRTTRIEFLALGKSGAGASLDAGIEVDIGIGADTDAVAGADAGVGAAASTTPTGRETNARENAPADDGACGSAHADESPRERDGALTDRLSKQCLRMADEYGLSSRETEVAELLARGRTGPAIAEELFISENTVRTHIKRIYAKVGVSKKQELLAVLEHAAPL